MLPWQPWLHQNLFQCEAWPLPGAELSKFQKPGWADSPHGHCSWGLELASCPGGLPKDLWLTAPPRSWRTVPCFGKCPGDGWMSYWCWVQRYFGPGHLQSPWGWTLPISCWPQYNPRRLTHLELCYFESHRPIWVVRLPSVLVFDKKINQQNSTLAIDVNFSSSACCFLTSSAAGLGNIKEVAQTLLEVLHSLPFDFLWSLPCFYR